MRNVLKWLLMSFWAVSLTAVVSTLMANHRAPLPHPEQGRVMPFQMGEAPDDSIAAMNQAGATCHFLHSGCRCSQRVVEHLLNRGPIEIIKKTLAGETLDGLPVDGCAVSTRLQDMVDPPGIKYEPIQRSRKAS